MVRIGLLWFVLALHGGLPAAADLEPGGTFFDDDGIVHEAGIEAIAAEEVTRGCGPPDLYCPDEPVTRGQMAAFLVRALHIPRTAQGRFRDLGDTIFAAEIEALGAAGITRGCAPNRYCPRRPVTRGQMAAFLRRALDLATPPSDRFRDDDGSVFEADIEALAGAGITHGCNPPANDRFCPNQPVTRAEMASFLARALGLRLPTVPSRPSLTMSFTGDVLIHQPVWRRAAAYGPPYDFRPMFEPIAPLIRSVDLAICHLEVPLSSDNRHLSGYPTFNAPREVAPALAATGYAGCSTASNHSFDQGEEGIASTIEVLAEAGLAQAGMAAEEADADRATIYRAEEATVAHLAATWWLNGFRLPLDKPWLVQSLDVDDLLEQAAAARAEGADVVVVSLHCCVEYRTEPTAYQRRVARQLIASPDIDLVVGHHAHVVQPVEEVEGEFIVYGLGNFLSGQRLRPATQDGVIVEIEFALRAGSWVARRVVAHPTWVEGGTYRILPAAQHHPASWTRTARALRMDGADIEVAR